jgi:hypothetical protein
MPRRNKPDNNSSDEEPPKKKTKKITPPKKENLKKENPKVVRFDSLGDAIKYLTENSPPKINNAKQFDEENFCKNPLCNHLPYKQDEARIDIPNIATIDSLDDLIVLGKSFYCKKNLEYRGLNLRLLCNIVPALNELNLMIGMQNIKTQVINQILFFIQGFNESTKCNKCIDCVYKLPCPLNKNEMLHTIVTGPPGVGKTQFSKILGKIYKGLGILLNGNFNEVKRSDLIAKYLGQTSHQTQDAINKATGGVLFIDEAYSLGNAQREDIFSKECIDTLTYNLSEKRDFLCIIAGYENALEECFFRTNEGLRRRFPFKYAFEEYSHTELLKIFENKINLSSWKLNYIEKQDKQMEEQIIRLFKENVKNLPNQGGDVESCMLMCKIVHSRKLPKVNERFILTNEDINEGFKSFIKNRANGKEDKDQTWRNMYT